MFNYYVGSSRNFSNCVAYFESLLMVSDYSTKLNMSQCQCRVFCFLNFYNGPTASSLLNLVQQYHLNTTWVNFTSLNERGQLFEFTTTIAAGNFVYFLGCFKCGRLLFCQKLCFSLLVLIVSLSHWLAKLFCCHQSFMLHSLAIVRGSHQTIENDL